VGYDVDKAYATPVVVLEGSLSDDLLDGPVWMIAVLSIAMLLLHDVVPFLKCLHLIIFVIDQNSRF
jgi:hypothetical protein